MNFVPLVHNNDMCRCPRLYARIQAELFAKYFKYSPHIAMNLLLEWNSWHTQPAHDVKQEVIEMLIDNEVICGCDTCQTTGRYVCLLTDTPQDPIQQLANEPDDESIGPKPGFTLLTTDHGAFEYWATDPSRIWDPITSDIM